MRKNKLNNPSSHKGAFTIVEVLLSLAIFAMLLTALVFAFQASVHNLSTNEDISKAMNTARQALLRMTADIRSASVEITEPSSQCSMVTSDGRDVTYRYDSTEDKLYMDINSGANAGNYVLCSNVTSMSFARSAVVDDPTAVKDVHISMTVTCGDINQLLTAAAVVRRNM